MQTGAQKTAFALSKVIECEIVANIFYFSAGWATKNYDDESNEGKLQKRGEKSQAQGD